MSSNASAIGKKCKMETCSQIKPTRMTQCGDVIYSKWAFSCFEFFAMKTDPLVAVNNRETLKALPQKKP